MDHPGSLPARQEDCFLPHLVFGYPAETDIRNNQHR